METKYYAIVHPTRGYYITGTQDQARYDWKGEVSAKKWPTAAEAKDYAYDCLQTYTQASLKVERVWI